MKRILISAALGLGITTLSAIITQCYADDLDTRTTTTCQRVAGGGYSCSTHTSSRTPRTLSSLSKEERAEIAMLEDERNERIAKWEAFCKPTIKEDAYGVSRYVYAHKNCDLGRSQ